MSAEYERRLDEVVTAYLKAVEAGRAPDRDELLTRHPELAADLAAFFVAESQVNRVAAPLRAPADEPTAGLGEPAPTGPGTRVTYFGDYHLLEEIGRGGMGVVYKARQESLNRVVALKMILTGQLANADDVRRFRAEAEAAAKLDHPGIVPVFEVGQHDGHHYFSMAFVEGESLAHKMVDGLPSPRDAALLVKQVAEAVTYAHVEGVIHRDLKPANILIDKNDQPRLTDFGLAKRVEGDGGLTQTGQIVGTPSYMPPEQANGQRDVGPLADVYSLGAILYCLLTGRPPFQADNPLDTLMQVLGRDPVPPRQLNAAIPRDLETICLKCLKKEPRRRYGSAQELVADLGRFLDARPILARPTSQWERTLKWARRRPAAAALVGVSAAAALVLLVGGIAFNARLQRALGEVASRQTDLDRANATAAENNTKLQAALADVGVKQTNLDAANGKAKEYEKSAHAQSRKADGVLLTANSVAVRPDNPGLALLLAIEGARRHRDALANHALWDALEACREEHTLDHSTTVNATANAAEFSPDGKWALTCSADGAARIWDVVAGKELRVLKEGTRFTSVLLGRFSPDGRRVLTITHPHHTAASPGTLTSGGTSVFGIIEDEKWKGMIPVARLWDPASGKLIAAWWQPYREGKYEFASPLSSEFSPNSRLVATAFGIYPDATVEVRETETGKLVSTLTGHQRAVVSAAFSPDSSKVVTASVDTTARIHEAATGKLLHELKGHTTGVMSARFSPNGKQVLTYGHGVDYRRMARGYDTYENAAARLWDAETGKELPSLRWEGEDKSWVWNASFNHDGTRIVTSGVDYFSDKHFAIWDAATGKRAVTFKGEAGRRIRVVGAVFSPDGRRVATSSHDNTASVWDAATGEELIVLSGHESRVRTVAFSADGRRLITSDDKTVRIWDVAERGSLRQRMLGWQASFPLFSADGRRLYLIPMRKTRKEAEKTGREDFRVLDAATGEELARAPIPSEPLGVGFLAATLDGRWLAFHDPASDAKNVAVAILDGTTLQKRFTLSGHEKELASVAFSPNQQYPCVVTVDGVGKVRVWSLTDGKLLHTLEVDADHPIRQAAAFDQVGGLLLTVNPPKRDGKVKDDDVRACVWDVSRGTRLATLRTSKTKSELADISSAVLSPDGKRAVLTFISHDAPRLWDVATGEEVQPLDHAGDQVHATAFSPDGKQIITGSYGKKARIWDAATGKLLRTLDHEGSVYGVAFSPDGKLVLTSSDSKAIRLWDVTTGQLVAHFKDPAGLVRGAFSTDGQSLLVIYLWPTGPSSGKNSARVWPLDPLAEAIRRKPRELTAAERERYGVKTGE